MGRYEYSTGKNIESLSQSRHLGRPKDDVTEDQLEKERLTDDIPARLQFDTGLSKESVKELRESIDKTLQNYSFEKDQSQKSVMELNMDALEDFLSAKRIESKSQNTIYNYGNELTKMMNSINKLYSEITTDDIREYMNFRKIHDGLSNTSIANIRMYMRSFFSWLKAEERIKKNPMERIAPVKQDKKVIETLSDEELEIIRCTCENERDLAIVDILSGSGMRVSELCRLNQDDVDIEQGTMKVFGKGSKERICYMTGRAKVHLKWYLAERTDSNPALFVTTKRPYERLSKNGVEYLLKEIAKKSGIPKLRLYPHKFRSTFVTDLINRGMPAEKVQALCGHQSVNTTLTSYTNMNDETLKFAHKQYMS